MVRLCRFEIDGNARVGAEVKQDGDIVDLVAGDDTIPNDVRAILAGGEAMMTKVKNAAEAKKVVVERKNVKILAPINTSEKVLCIGMNYVDHCTEQNLPVPDEPVVFSKFASAISNPGDDIVRAPEVKELDFEVEMVIVVGKDCKRVSEADAMQYVAGYTVAHDVSARDWQLKKNGGQWLIGKSFDGYAPIGPAIVTTDELKDPHNLGIRCRLNGETVQDSNTNQLVFKTEAIMAWVTKFFSLKAGDLILTGTPPGVGCFRKPPLWLKDGDVVDCEIDGIGTITNTVRDEVRTCLLACLLDRY
eukprot:TRINITY_DN12124_c0_g2_i1.p1 TRINITY_DN12124_c0_g2~~TRINITY_DN12124_c0_g2_i1.p1  ORF type:complete len:303 (+),score=99.50 TRINITY_DN12124_c0_g2_i1:216-1124(+)